MGMGARGPFPFGFLKIPILILHEPKNSAPMCCQVSAHVYLCSRCVRFGFWILSRCRSGLRQDVGRFAASTSAGWNPEMRDKVHTLQRPGRQASCVPKISTLWSELRRRLRRHCVHLDLNRGLTQAISIPLKNLKGLKLCLARAPPAVPTNPEACLRYEVLRFLCFN